MSEHLPDVELTDEQDDRATALERAVIERPASAACLIVYQQDRIAELIESLRQQESQLRTALDELRAITTQAEQPLTWETFWQAVRESNWNPSPDDLRKILNKQIEQGAGPEIPACTAVTTEATR